MERTVGQLGIRQTGEEVQEGSLIRKRWEDAQDELDAWGQVGASYSLSFQSERGSPSHAMPCAVYSQTLRSLAKFYI